MYTVWQFAQFTILPYLFLSLKTDKNKKKLIFAAALAAPATPSLIIVPRHSPFETGTTQDVHAISDVLGLLWAATANWYNLPGSSSSRVDVTLGGTLRHSRDWSQP